MIRYDSISYSSCHDSYWCSSINKHGLVVDVTIYDDTMETIDAIDTTASTASTEIHFKCIQSDKIKK